MNAVRGLLDLPIIDAGLFWPIILEREKRREMKKKDENKFIANKKK